MTQSREIFLKGYILPLKDIENVCLFYAKYPKWIILNAVVQDKPIPVAK